jgi:hypothetical protein
MIETRPQKAVAEGDDPGRHEALQLLYSTSVTARGCNSHKK